MLSFLVQLSHPYMTTVQLSHQYMTTGKTIALTRQTFVDKVMSLLFNMLSRLVITFLPRSNYLLISWLQSPSAVILESKNIKSGLFPHLFAMKWRDCMPWSSFLNVEFYTNFFTFIKRLFSSSVSAMRVSSAHPSNLDFSLCFIQPSISHDALCI